jgi:hypothetical protein
MGQRATTREDIFYWPLDQKMPLEEFLAGIHAVIDSLPADQRATAVVESRSGIFRVYYARLMTAEDIRHSEQALANVSAVSHGRP